MNNEELLNYVLNTIIENIEYDDISEDIKVIGNKIILNDKFVIKFEIDIIINNTIFHFLFSFV